MIAIEHWKYDYDLINELNFEIRYLLKGWYAVKQINFNINQSFSW